MKNSIIFLIIPFFISCSSKVSREDAILYKEAIVEITDKNIEPCQTFIDNASIIIADSKKYKVHKIKCDYIFGLLAKAKKSNNTAILKLKEIKEIDDEINYRDSYISYLYAEKNVFLALESWLNYIEKNGNVNMHEEDRIFNAVRKKLSIMYDKQLVIEDKIEDFNIKYKL
ncbi:MAG: hypothetical protein GXO80_04830 [Chlorobi bacterium]|nr:hypothetical protein [Chlorobiota bacterium]